MSRERAWLLAGIVLAAGIGLATTLTRKRPKLGPDSRILLVGDSLAVGLRPHLEALAKDLGLPFAAAVQSGTTTSAWVESVASALASQPSLVLISLGTNDIYGKRDPADVADDALAILDALSKSPSPTCDGDGPDVVWIGPPTLPLEDGIRGAIREAVTAYSPACGVAAWYPSETLDIRRTADGVHPTASGYAGWAGALWQWLS